MVGMYDTFARTMGCKGGHVQNGVLHRAALDAQYNIFFFSGLTFISPRSRNRFVWSLLVLQL